MNIELKFRKTVVQDKLVQPGSSVVLAVSGGVDSMVMLSLFARFRSAADLSLTVAHINHNLRGEASDAEEQLVRQTAEEYGIPFFSVRWHYSGDGNLQDTARRFRQDFLIKTAANAQASYIATGHHQDDQVETVLLHLLRGSGLKGLGGMAWSAERGSGVRFIKPMLNISRAEIAFYAHEQDIRYAKDASNMSCAYARNDVRHNLVPRLEGLNPSVRSSIAAMADRLRDDEAALIDLARRFCDQELIMDEGGVRMSRDAVIKLPVSVMRRVFRIAYERLTGSTADLTADHIEKMDYLTIQGNDESEYPLPGGYTFCRSFNRLKIVAK